MAKGYWVVNNVVDDPEAYRVYQAFVGPYLAGRGAKFLTRGGQQTIVEGELLPRTMIVEFPSYADAVAAYETADYENARKLRLGLSRGTFAIVEGLGG
ncbi:MAG: hypothetical protein JWQ89_1267 [Devosia sp.]|uniref:DUF1330 domain-containing protein n=1 Tax=Devosia sp. TaxID=1871048 RepID=UPI00262D4400|nr:DUF1330 domain-containing protein [Devosia sp.]MDB5539540.1 hypothetical protein [Devosia sp.]